KSRSAESISDWLGCGAACPKPANSLLAVASDETLFRVTNSRYHANPSSDRVSFRRRCNGLTFPWRAVAHYWGEGGNESRQRSEMFKIRPPLSCSATLISRPIDN